jgi:hypothetical protein
VEQLIDTLALGLSQKMVVLGLTIFSMGLGLILSHPTLEAAKKREDLRDEGLLFWSGRITYNLPK